MKLLGLLLVLLATAGWAAETPLATIDVAGCRLTAHADTRWQVLLIRPQPVAESCRATLDALTTLTTDALNASARRSDALYRSISLGRLVAYPALSQDLARTAATDPRWHRRRGHARDGHDNRLVGLLLFELLRPLTPTLARHGYRLIGVSVEKVLIAPAAELLPPAEAKPKGRLPYDAQVWLRLERMSDPMQANHDRHAP